MKTALLIAAGVAALSLAACNKPAEETGANAMSSEPAEASPASENAMAPASGSTSSPTPASSGAMSSETQTMAPAASSGMSGQAMTSTVPTTQETVDATKGTLSPGGASSGATAPRPAN